MVNYDELIAALTADYLNLFVVRPQEDSADIIKLTGYVTTGIKDTPKNFPYFKLLKTYADERVHPEDRDHLLEVLSVDSLMKYFADESKNDLEIDYRILEADGSVHRYSARYSRLSKPGEELRVVVGFRNIDYITSIAKENRDEGLLNAYSTIANSFFSLHRINVQTNSFATIKTMPTVVKLSIDGSDEYDANVRQIMTGISSDQSREDALRFVDRATLEARMQGKKQISMEFWSYANELCRLTFYREDNDENGKLLHVILAVEKVEDELSRAVINSLAHDYQYVFSINLEDGSFRTLKMAEIFSDMVTEQGGKEYSYAETTADYILKRVHPDDRARVAKDVSLLSLRETFRDKDELTGSYRVLVNGEIHHFRYSFSKLANLNYIVAAFRNIDDLIAQHDEEERRQREAEIAAQKQREEQLAIFDALARNFKNVYMVDLQNDTARVLKLEDEHNDHEIDRFGGQEFEYEPFVNRWIDSMVHPDDREMLKAALSPAHLREVFPKEEEYTGNYRQVIDGKTIHYQFKTVLMEDKKRIIAGFQNVDAIIREHLEEERKRREVEQAYQKQLEDQLKVVNTLTRSFRNVYIVDLAKQTMKVLKLDNVYKSIYKIGDAQEFPFDSVRAIWLQTVLPEDREEIAETFTVESFRKLLAEQDDASGYYRGDVDGKVHHFQYTISKVDGNPDKAVLGYQIVDSIVEEHLAQERKEREQEEARLNAEHAFNTVISSLSTIYSTILNANVDTHHYEVLNSIPLMYSVAGTEGNFDDTKQTIINNLMAPEFRPLMDVFLDLDTLKDRLKNTNTVATEYKSPSGQWLESRFIARNRGEDGLVKDILYTARDITIEKERELTQQDQLSHALAAAQQANKAKSTFLNSMSHDIRTPMNAIIGFTALAQTHMDDQEAVRDYLGKISTSSTHLLSLINDVLDMSRIESGTVKLEEKPIHLPDLLHDLRTMIQGLVDSKNLNLFIDTQDVENEDVISDRLRLNQVLINIVGNAVKYTQPGGDIMIRLIEKPCSMKGYTTYEFTVKDNGIGMSKEFISHIFETFSRERSSTVTGIQGTGLGMAITKNIVDMMGGTITAESEPGKGSLFTVTLNLRLASGPVKYQPIPDLLGARALVVDDDLNTCRSVSKMLRDIQMRPDWTASGKEAIVRAQEAAELQDEYKVYIIDYLMPDMNGIETVRRIRRVISEEVPIIVLTAYDWTDFEQEAKEAGVTAFVSKPLFMSELRTVLTMEEPHEDSKKKEEKHYDYNGKHVLLVEDNDLNREIATALLESAGIKVDCATDGTEAVDMMYKAAEDEYDLIFMDIQMPKMDGYTATHEIRTLSNNKKANIPIVAMTANAFEEDRKKSLEAGMNGHITKPISMSDIAEALDKIFAGK